MVAHAFGESGGRHLPDIRDVLLGEDRVVGLLGGHQVAEGAFFVPGEVGAVILVADEEAILAPTWAMRRMTAPLSVVAS
ncbi:MAG: hypothetical protein M5U22_10105 [Thermoleophilia bacterium]|nr:hypothetical protein [Thermoleophilia bacterium]